LRATPGTLAPQPQAMSLYRILGLAFLGGLILNLMPCVFPILALKVVGLAGAARDKVRRHAAAYTAGVLVAFAALGGALLAARAAGTAAGWGFQFQTPMFVTAMAWLLFVVGLNLSGVFEIGTGLVSTGRGLAVPECEAFETPLGLIPLDLEGIKALADLKQVVRSADRNRSEQRECCSIQERLSHGLHGCLNGYALIEQFFCVSVGEILASDFEGAFAERDAQIAVGCETFDGCVERGFRFHDFAYTGIFVGPGYDRRVRWTINQQRQASRSVICKFARECHLHVASVGQIERHGHKERVALFAQPS